MLKQILLFTSIIIVAFLIYTFIKNAANINNFLRVMNVYERQVYYIVDDDFKYQKNHTYHYAIPSTIPIPYDVDLLVERSEPRTEYIHEDVRPIYKALEPLFIQHQISYNNKTERVSIKQSKLPKYSLYASYELFKFQRPFMWKNHQTINIDITTGDAELPEFLENKKMILYVYRGTSL